jgi:ABC-type amino acid transport substrate-binding protein
MKVMESGFAVDIAEAITDDVRKKLNKPDLQVAYLPVGASNRIPLLMDGTCDL